MIAGRVGDKVAQDDCLVTSSQNAPFIACGDDFAHVTDTVQFNLNCNGGYATATTPGPRWPARRAGKPRPPRTQAAAEEQQTLEEVSTPEPVAVSSSTPG